MSYEEAKQDRRRNRKNQRMQLFLGMLQAAGQSIGAMQRQKKAEELAGQERALKERSLGLQERGLEQEMESTQSRNETQLEVARINAQGRGQDRRTAQWEAEAEGALEAYGGGDPKAALKSIAEMRAQRQRENPLADMKDLDNTASMLTALLGKRKLESGQRSEPQVTGDLETESGTPAQSGMAGGPGPWQGQYGQQPMPGANPMLQGQAGSMQTAPQSVQAQITYERLADAYRRFHASGGRDLGALAQLNELFGGTLPIPRAAATGMPQPMQRTTTGLGTTTMPR
jgi:hypothetical protein